VDNEDAPVEDIVNEIRENAVQERSAIVSPELFFVEK